MGDRRLSQRPAPSRDHHQYFCDIEGWSPPVNARGKPVAHHQTLELLLHDGRILRTRISRPVDRTTYGPSIWSHILRDQLDVSADEFWACVLDKQLPDRGAPTTPPDSLPANLVFGLIRDVGLTADEVASLSKDEAVERMQRFWTDGK